MNDERQNELMELNEMTKRDRTQYWLNHNKEINLACIHCQERLELQGYSLVCQNNHRFDMAKQGYYFLAKKASQTKYDASLFKSRRKIILDTKLYTPLHQFISEYLQANFPQDAVIIDAGSGEGSHLWRMTESVDNHNYSLIATDLSKDAIQVATDYNGHMLALISDLAELPLGDNQVDVVLSIFSPSNYSEFGRVIKESGQLIKIVPNSGYLQQIRNTLIEMEVGNIHSYSNDDVVNIFKQYYEDYRIEVINQTVQLNTQELDNLVTMTPLTWQLSPEQREELLERLDGNISLDVSVLIGEN